MTIRQILHMVKSSYNGGVGSDDSRLRPRLVYSKVRTAYADLLNDPRIPIMINDFSMETLDCVEIIPSTPYECECIPNLGCKVYRTKYKIPTPLTNKNTMRFGPVRTISGDREFSVLPHSQVAYIKNSKYGGSFDVSFIKNDYLYILTSLGDQEVISITLLPEDPFKVAEFKTLRSECNPSQECTSILDINFKMDPQLVNKVVLKAAEELMNHFSKSMKDQDNDGKEPSKT